MSSAQQTPQDNCLSTRTTMSHKPLCECQCLCTTAILAFSLQSLQLLLWVLKLMTLSCAIDDPHSPHRANQFHFQLWAQKPQMFIRIYSKGTTEYRSCLRFVQLAQQYDLRIRNFLCKQAKSWHSWARIPKVCRDNAHVWQGITWQHFYRSLSGITPARFWWTVLLVDCISDSNYSSSHSHKLALFLPFYFQHVSPW